MSKIVLTDLANLQNETTAVNAINSNSAAITAAFDNTLSRDGTAPNTMLSSLDMNSKSIINLPVPASSTEPIRVLDAALLNGGGSITIQGTPTGGLTGQVLTKASNTNYDTTWTTQLSNITLEQYGGGIAKTGAQNVTAWNSLVSANPNGFQVTFNAGNYVFNSTLTVPQKVVLQGSAVYGCTLQFQPTSNSSFLSFGAANSLDWSSFALKDISIYSSDTTFTKVAVDLIDFNGVMFENTIIYGAGGFGTWSGGTGSGAVRTRGRQFLKCYGFNTWAADKPLQHSLNPNVNIAADSFDFKGVYFLSSGTTFPLVTVDPGVITYDTYYEECNWVTGSYGYYSNDTSPFNLVNGIVAGGSGYAIGDIISIAGGTFTQQAQVRVVSVSGGAVTTAVLFTPGVYSVNYPNLPATQASTSGSGTGCTFNMANLVNTSSLTLGGRSEQGNPAGVDYSVYINCKVGSYGCVNLRNFTFDNARKGLFAKGIKNLNLYNCSYVFSIGPSEALNIDANINHFNISGCYWGLGTTAVIGLLPYWYCASPSGSSVTIPPSALYGGSGGFAASTVTTNSVTYVGATSGTSFVHAPTVAGSGSFTLPASATDTLVARASTDTLTNKTLTSPVITSPAITLPTIDGASPAQRMVVTRGVNFNLANTDTTIAIPLPSGFTRYQVQSIVIGNASSTLVASTFGVFSAAAAGGTAVVASGTASAVTASAAETAANFQSATLTATGATALDFANLFFRVQTAKGTAATADVTVIYYPLS